MVDMDRTNDTIREFYDFNQGKVYMGFSGGRDSIVLRHLVQSIYPEVKTVYCATGMEYPEVHKSGLTADVILRPKMSFKDVIDKYGWTVVSKDQSQKLDEYRNTNSDKLRNIRWNGVRRNGGKMLTGKIAEKWKFLADAPFKISGKCCDVFKKNPSKSYERATGCYPYTGERADEGMNRRGRPCNSFGARPKSKPLNHWALKDVKNYIIEHNLEIPAVYEDRMVGGCEVKGEERTGCMFCLIGCHKPEDSKFEKMKIAYPKQYDYIMNKLGGADVLKIVVGGE